MFIPKEHPDIPLIIVDNFLPTQYCKNLMEDIKKLKPLYSTSHWVEGPQTGLNQNCTGEDLWLPFGEEEDIKNEQIGESIANLWNYLFHFGLLDFIDNSKHPELNLYSKFKYNFAYHIINYPNSGYYNWHKDSILEGMTWRGYDVCKDTTYTFALTLIDDESNIVSGGRQLFMKDGNIFELESKNNQLVIFPSSVYHSLTEIEYKDDLPWESRRFNLQAWLCHL